MERTPLIAAVLAAAFVFPLSASANTGKTSGDKSASASSAPATTATNDGGAEAMFKSMDKNGDGFISKDEAKGTPHEAAFDTLDTNHDGKLSRAEHAAAPEHVAARAKADTTASATDTSGTKKY